MTARFSPSEIAAAAREARANGVAVELHKPDGSKIVAKPVDGSTESAHVARSEGNSCDKAFGP